MDIRLEFVIRSGLIGMGGSAAMDLWALFLRLAFDVKSLDYKLFGRWIGHLPHGQFSHHDIVETPTVLGETVIGWTAHYLVGVVFAGLLLLLWGVGWARTPTFIPAFVVGIGTVLAPFFILQPGMGAGVAASKLPKPNVARAKSIGAHLAYAFGLYATARLTAILIPS